MYLTNTERLDLDLVGPSVVAEEVVTAAKGGCPDGMCGLRAPDFSSMTKVRIAEWALANHGAVISTDQTKDEMVVAAEQLTGVG
jgi:hypothetical protein